MNDFVYQIYLKNRKNMTNFVKITSFRDKAIEDFPLLRLQYKRGEIYIDRHVCYEGEQQEGD